MIISCNYINNPENWNIIRKLIPFTRIFQFSSLNVKGLSDETIKEFSINYWTYISRHRELSEDFIRENQDKVDWYYISAYQKLSESFIREFGHKVIWNSFLNRDIYLKSL